MAMKKPDSKVADQLWTQACPQLEHVVGIYVRNGVTRKKGQTAKEAMHDVLVDLMKSTYLLGLHQGYDLGHHVFAPPAAAVEGEEPAG